MRFDNITAKGCYPPDCTSTTSTTSTSSTSSTSTSTASTTTCGSVALGTVSPDITSASPSSFGVFPPGNYEVLYLYGALQYNNALTPPVFQINDWNNGHGYQIVFSGGLSQIQGPGLSTGYSSQEDVEDANTGQSVQFYHAGGIIGMFLFDNPYSDNVSGLTANPTFRLFSICGAPTPSTSTTTQSTTTSTTTTLTTTSTSTTSTTSTATSTSTTTAP